MAKQQLPTNFKDDVLTSQMVGKRRYNLIQNEDGTISLEDVTNYSQIGSNFGAAQMNATNLAVNESFDKNKVIDSLADISANEAAGYAAGALAVRELNGNMPIIIPFTVPAFQASTPVHDVTVDLGVTMKDANYVVSVGNQSINVAYTSYKWLDYTISKKTASSIDISFYNEQSKAIGKTNWALIVFP